MTDFKSVYDALVGQYETVQAVAERIEAHFAAGEIDDALALEQELDAANAKAEQIAALYQKLTSIGDASPQQVFVPAAEGGPEPDSPQVLSRAEFDALPPSEKAAYVAAGGQIVDHKQE